MTELKSNATIHFTGMQLSLDVNYFATSFNSFSESSSGFVKLLAPEFGIYILANLFIS
jgi:hypothetical protein